ncbi:hypothetical protein VTK73DRAFT_9126 [Phialemonium thermophilum]|uniref:RING-type domain-containing protein n=1 Tax=Phialemonium thermophilum TaxID=223376 RepID=A0ABR3W4A0_9PEZI
MPPPSSFPLHFGIHSSAGQHGSSSSKFPSALRGRTNPTDIPDDDDECFDLDFTIRRPPQRGPYVAGEQETLWHKLKAYLREPTGPRPRAVCVICLMSKLRIRGLDQSGSKEDMEYAIVLPCGHMFGVTCFMKARRDRFARDMPFPCPLCKCDLEFLECRHAVHGILAPAHDHQPLDRVPPTLPEGGKVPLRCNQCRAAEVASLAEGIGDKIWNPFGELDGDVLSIVRREYVDMTKRLLAEEMDNERRPSWADKPRHLWDGA